MMGRTLILSLFFSSLSAGAQTVHIKIIDGKTGRSLSGLRVGVQVGHIDERRFWKVDKEAVVGWSGESYDVSTDGAPLLEDSALVKGHTVTSDYEVCSDENCAHGGGPGTYPVRDILSTRINTLDARSTAKIPFQHGVLTLYVRKITWLDRLVRRLYS